MIETRLLTYFLAVAREQNITRAAESLHISQPALSKQMQDLEEQCGKQLLIRGRKKITLTDEGAYLRKSAQEIVDLIEKTETSFQDSNSPISGDIYITCGETPIMEYLSGIFADIQSEYSNVHFHIHSGDADTIVERLDKGLADIGILHGPSQYERYDYRKLPVHDYFGLLVPLDSPLAQKEIISVDELIDMPLIFPDQAYSGNQNFEWFGTAYNKFNIVATYNLIGNATYLVEKGIGSALCLKNLVNTTNRNLAFCSIEPLIPVDIYVVTKKYQSLPSAVRLFLSKLN